MLTLMHTLGEGTRTDHRGTRGQVLYRSRGSSWWFPRGKW